MKTTSNKFTALIIAVLAIGFATVSTSPSMAVNGDPNDAACTRMNTLSNTSRATVSAHVSTMQSDFATRLLRISSNGADVDQKVLDARTAANEKFEEKIAELEAREGLTTEQLAAINTYRVNMQTAEETRSSAVDAARNTYRIALRETIQTQQTVLATAVEAYQATVGDALNTAKENCSENSSRSTLQATIRTARETLSTVRQSTKAGEDIKALASTRNDAIKAAGDAFRTSAATHTAILVAALQVAQ